MNDVVESRPWRRPSAPRMVLEREHELELLAEALDAAQTGRGSLIFVLGEAGVGKTTLVRKFIENCAAGTALIGTCDPLQTPRALGPLFEVAASLGHDFVDEIAGSTSGADLFMRLTGRLSSFPSAPVLAFEDIQWADQGTTDLIRFVGRRVERMRLLVIATIRDEGLEPNGPTAILLGDLATAPGVGRLNLARLSRAATSRLAEGSDINGDVLYNRTGGNPFYIGEVLVAGGASLPATVRDAVLARSSRLSPVARQCLEAAAAIGPRVSADLLAVVIDGIGAPRWSVRETVAAGFLDWSGDLLVFRHELAQAAIADATSAEQRQRLHALILRSLLARPIEAQQLATLVQHADGAGDDAAVLEFAPLAAAHAARLHAHREAAAFYTRGLACAQRSSPSLVADLTERRAVERRKAGQLAEASDDFRAAAELWHRQDDQLRRGRNLTCLSMLSFLAGQYAKAETIGQIAVDCLESMPPSPELVAAYRSRGEFLFMGLEADGAESWAARGLALAQQLGDLDASLDAAVTVGAARLLSGRDERGQDLRAALESARPRGLEELVARATLYLAWLPMLHRRYDDVEQYLDEGWRYATEHDLGYWQLLIAGARVRWCLDKGKWSEVEPAAKFILDRPDAVSLAKLQALLAMGRLKARLGDRRGRGYLESALALTVEHHRPGTVTPAWPALAEAAWLVGDHAAVYKVSQGAREHGMTDWSPWSVGELAMWMHLAGRSLDVELPIAEPYARAIAGDDAGAAMFWNERGCQYEEGIALTTSQDTQAVLRGLSIFDRLGATPAASYARRRLRELGVRSIPRGPQAATSANPGRLTRRELEVLDLVAAGSRNSDIAAQLFLSEKTVERHLASIFGKLGVSNRSDAIRQAQKASGSTSSQK